jgi:hypothetical protein
MIWNPNRLPQTGGHRRERSKQEHHPIINFLFVLEMKFFQLFLHPLADAHPENSALSSEAFKRDDWENKQ